MLDQFTIATKGGVILWNKEYAGVAGHPVDSLIQDEIIPGGRTDTSKYTAGAYTLQWTFANELNVIFVAVYQKILQLPYIEDMLRHIKRHFIARFEQEIKSLMDSSSVEFPDFSAFDGEFEQVWKAVEERDRKEKQGRMSAPRKFEETKKFQSTVKGAQAEMEELAQAKELAFAEGPSRRQGSKMRSWTDRKAASGSGTEDETKKKGKKGKKAKENRVWDDQITKASMAALDFSQSKHKGTQNGNDDDNSSDNKGGRSVSTLVDERSKGVRTADGIYEVADVAERTTDPTNGFVLLDDDGNDEQNNNNAKSTGIFGMFKNLTSGRVLTAEILAEPMARMREHLANKNVAAEIADQICQTVAKGMVGVRVGGLQNIRKLVEQNMESALTRILTPISSTDIIRDIEFIKRQQKRPYTMAFVGVNGVGKSTNLSKVCYWLLQNNKRVLIAACDTFRSGAVEQLRVHVRNLRALSENQNVEIFERGYGKDSAAIAKDAIAFGAANGFDVVLIDTAGRMQDNEPLMRALAKLVSVNTPDKILFVGEALVGNEAVDQLQKFNQALRDFSGMSKPRHIDGIILTKFDTIDDRVGAALSMTYTTGQPIVFVGTGQTYTDLRKMNVSQVIRALLRP
ncbi:hypothetical protein GGI25_005859 [Coemansia spiralis]|uniref:SRP54-type proteins GTP-binding domain-containing protein n=2 Tax=Coemansia TaxID=4863 RepID=A0A9W8KW27_9FUNG|nr:SRP54-type protein [Coemansia spiralis]KAJ1988607.1 hypothetical protein EDC05_005212 [Coemansia umbellata]KAJ2623400.1 hypothetical protein GGI26_002438 [Coemansia sp. RSA 1358]KAJ2670394.1 hypothetical protein GGI25_005859 [Coemansia spiralis]